MVSVKRINDIIKRMENGTTTIDDAEAISALIRAMATRLTELAQDSHERATWAVWAKSVKNARARERGGVHHAMGEKHRETEGGISMACEVMEEISLDHIAQPKRIMAPFWWYGGKGHLTRWIVPLLPREGVKVYCEPFCGAASVFWHLPEPYPVEVLNDKNKYVITLFRVLQDAGKFAEFRHRIIWTPYALAELERAIDMMERWEELDDVDRAWAFYVTSNQGINGRARNASWWSKVFVSSRGMAKNCNSWRGRMKMLEFWHDRLTRVQLDCRDALEVIRYWDSPETLFYLDPPYVHSTRKCKEEYVHEMSDEQHRELVSVLLNIKGKAALSGYDNEIYKPLEDAGWRRLERKMACHTAVAHRATNLRGEGNIIKNAPRVEVLWVNYDV